MGCTSSKFREKTESIESQSSQIEFPTEFRYVDGRRFHNVENAVYPLPNDYDELDRLHLQHFMMKFIWQNNFSAPINHTLSNPGTKVLDVGYPLVEFVGLDISPLQPTQIKPKNFKFVKANVLEGLPFEDNTFDFVFQRYMFTGCTKEKWPYLINEIVRVLKPGGFLELSEPSKMFDLGPATQRLFNGLIELMEKRGLDSNIYQKLEDYLQNQGQLENIKKEVKQCYHGVKSNNIKLSKVVVNNMVTAYGSFKLALLEALQISNEEFDELVKISEKELFDFDSFNYLPRVYASKVIDDNSEN
ncbi:548_t:CDS:2 [Dentiscutata erythropus]|uniref:548_t:CDS:1 n=1 Tax=Dentiscutata erythropus TaxID=1348616 RepID=A0A9N9CHW6_9GLOM|nr:548_t:CDS:2 [Dentiscutata erythropus]